MKEVADEALYQLLVRAVLQPANTQLSKYQQDVLNACNIESAMEVLREDPAAMREFTAAFIAEMGDKLNATLNDISDDLNADRIIREDLEGTHSLCQSVLSELAELCKTPESNNNHGYRQ
jgi:hypothetical protein